MCNRTDPQDGFSADEHDAYDYEAEGLAEDCEGENEWEDDGQPTEYDEWQDLYGGDDYDHGQFENDY
jgi:hypothetical protein